MHIDSFISRAARYTPSSTINLPLTKKQKSDKVNFLNPPIYYRFSSPLARQSGWSKCPLVVVSGCELADFHDYLHGFLHDLDGNKLVRPVEIDAASEDVRAG